MITGSDMLIFWLSRICLGPLATLVIMLPVSGFAADAVSPSRPPLPWPDTPPAAPAFARADTIAAVGGKLFFDPSLSASGRMSCATCHDPAHGFGPPNALPVQLGGRYL